jgi:tetratricopeptide (TPR) repeat protein
LTFTFTRAELEAEREEAAARVAERPGKVSYQRLGRAHRWLDDEDAAREAFREGAAYMKANVLEKGRSQNAAGWLEYGLLLRAAGDAEAREWFTRALEAEGADSVRRAQLRYLLGQPPGSAPDGPVWEQALNAPEQSRAAVEDALRKERALPSYTAPALTLWDLLEETYRADGISHAEMLTRSGFLTG